MKKLIREIAICLLSKKTKKAIKEIIPKGNTREISLEVMILNGDKLIGTNTEKKILFLN